MGLRQVGFGFVVLVVFGFSGAQWLGRSSRDRDHVLFKPSALAQVPFQQVESRILQVPQTSDPSRPVFAPQKFPDQAFVQKPTGPAQDFMGVQSKELLQGPVVPLTWRFPSLPEEPQQPDIPFELSRPIPAKSVSAQCGEYSVYVEVEKDFFGTGKPLMPSAFTMGGCTATGEDPSAQVLMFESELHGCGSMLTVTENELVYTFNLLYTPQEASFALPIVRSSGAVVSIECHYPRLHNVSSNALLPTWVPYASTIVAEELLVFSLRLMTDDWRFERPSNQYFLGDLINIEASVTSYNHVPLRLFVDSCVATSVPNASAFPIYSFIENNGCMVDAKITSSRSRFLARTTGDALQFQLDAFRFQQADSGLVYITCIVKVAAATSLTSPEQKACSFSGNGWLSADETNQVCSCCDTTCSLGSGNDQSLTDLRWENTFVGPIHVKEHGFGQM